MKEGIAPIEAVAAIIERTTSIGKREILIIEETETTSWKEAEDCSIPMETMEPGETLLEAVERLIREEVTEDKIKYQIEKLVRVKPYIILGKQGEVAEVSCFLVRWLEEKENFEKGEVINHRWVRPKEVLRLKLRPGAKEMVQDYIKSFSEKEVNKNGL